MLVGKELTFMDSLMIAATGILIVMLELAMLAVIVLLLSKAVRAFENRGNDSSEEAEPVKTIPLPAPAAAPAPAPVSAPAVNGIQLIDTDEPTAAAIMAIVSDQSGIPLENLQFRSIRHIVADDKTMAVILALISQESGIPVERLQIKSIKELN